MRRRNRTVRQRVEDMTFDLNLAPMLDMMVALVPFLLLSVVFIRLVVIESPVPQPVAKAIQADKDKKDKTVFVKLYLYNNRTVQLQEVVNGKKRVYRLKANDKNFDLEKLHKTLVSIKLKHQDVYSLELFPSQEVSYKEIIKVMDEARSAKVDGPSFKVKAKGENKDVHTKFMFPNITFGNVVEG